MRIAVDLDGVMYEWEKTARYLLRTQKGYSGLTEPSDGWWYIRDIVSGQDWEWLWTTGVRLGLFRYGHVVKGAIEGIRALHGFGHELLVVTHRPKNAVPDTIDWLAYLRLPFAGIHILSEGEPKTSVQADVLIDDKPDNLIEWAATGRWAVRFVRPWNQDNTYSYQVVHADGWPAVIEAIKEIESYAYAEVD